MFYESFSTYITIVNRRGATDEKKKNIDREESVIYVAGTNSFSVKHIYFK